MSINELMEIYESVECDRKSIPQVELDLANKVRSSIFPWRGQFSPELVELLLTAYADTAAKVLDPFAGMGTTLFECARKNISCVGYDINPAAYIMGKTAEFSSMSQEHRMTLAETGLGLAQEICNKHKNFQSDSPKNRILKIPDIADESCRDGSQYAHNIVINGLIRTANGKKLNDISGLVEKTLEHCSIIRRMPFSERAYSMNLGDARKLSLPDKCINLIITSPPYINVFNYHQNHRDVMELLGWNLLNIAKAEFGSNRKNRGNRYLTITQYSIDMLAALAEMRRVITETGRLIIVIGRESKVRKVSFPNGKLVAAIALGGAGFSLESRQERRFKNKFGQLIVEDILHLRPNKSKLKGECFAQKIAAELMLSRLESEQLDDEQKNDLEKAIEQASLVKASPLIEFRKVLY